MNNQDWSISHQWALRHNCWIAYLKCSVVYDGTAVGYLSSGDYVVMCKADGSVSVSGGDLNKFKNYIRSTERYGKENIITFKNKKEELHLDIDELYWFQPINSWACNKVSLYRTEAQLVDKLVREMDTWVPFSECRIIYREYQTDAGPVDVAVRVTNDIHLFEVKRRKSTIKDITQVLKYDDNIIDRNAKLYLVAPSISDNALAYADKHNVKFIELDWDPMPEAFASLI